MSKRINVMELFQKATQGVAPVTAGSPHDQWSDELPLNKWSPIPENGNIKVDKREGLDLPEFMSELAPIDMDDRSTTACVGSNLLCIAQRNFLHVIDLSTGQRNDSNISNSENDIIDVSFNSNSNIVLYTDGQNVCLVKITSGASGVHLNGCVYMRGVGSVSDPVRQVRFHPGSGPNFVTVKTTGWTIWDTARLIMKSSISDKCRPELFRSEIFNVDSMAEDFIPWKKSSNTFAGKKVSPGVLAILKRGASPDVATESAVASEVAFEFSRNGKFAVALVDDVLRAWSIGPQCATIESLPMRDDVIGRSMKKVLPFGDNSFVAAATNRIVHFTLQPDLVIDRNLNFNDADIAGMTTLGSTLVVAASPVSFLIDETRVCPLGQPRIEQVEAVCAAAPSSLFWRVAGQWISQTCQPEVAKEESRPFVQGEQFIEEPPEEQTAEEEEKESEYRDASPTFEDYEPRKDSLGPETVQPPDRLVSSFAMDQWVAEVSQGQDAIDLLVQAKIDRLVHAQVAEAVREKLVRIEQSSRSLMEAEREKTLKLVKQVMKKQFKEGMDQLFSQIEIELEKIISSKKSISFNQLDGAIDRLSVSMSHQDRLAMNEVSRLTSWWKKSEMNAKSLNEFLAGCAQIGTPAVESLEDPVMACFNLLVLTEWLRGRQDAVVLGLARFVVNSLVAHDWSGCEPETQELCSKSLSKAIRNAVGASPTDLVEAIRGLMMKLGAVSRASTPRLSNVQGSSILQMLQKR